MLMRDDLRDWLDPEAPSRPARLFRAWQFLAVFGGVGIAIASSVDEIGASDIGPWLVAAAGVVMVAFAAEYGVLLMLAREACLAATGLVAQACRRDYPSAARSIHLTTVPPMAQAIAVGA